MMRVGLYRPVHVKTLASQKRRMLLTSRQLLQAKALDIENDLRGTLRNFGLKVGMAGTVKFEARILELVADHPDVPAVVSSPDAYEVAAKHIDTYLSWGETPEQAEAKVRAVKGLATSHGRTGKISFGIRLYVIVRETEEAAWA